MLSELGPPNDRGAPLLGGAPLIGILRYNEFSVRGLSLFHPSAKAEIKSFPTFYDMKSFPKLTCLYEDYQ